MSQAVDLNQEKNQKTEPGHAAVKKKKKMGDMRSTQQKFEKGDEGARRQRDRRGALAGG